MKDALLQAALTCIVIAAPSFLAGIAAACIWHNRRITKTHLNQLRYNIRR